MHKLIRKAARGIFIEWSRLLQYRLDIFLWTLGDLLMPFISLALWYNVALAGNTSFNPQETVTYYVFSSVVFIATGAWGGFFLSNQILKGDLVLYLIRPYSVFLHYAINNIVEKVLKLFFPITILIISLFFWPQVFDTSFLADPIRWPWFIVATLLGATIFFTLDMAVGLLAFWLEDAVQIRSYIYMVSTVASGLFIPLAFMPESLQSTLSYLPFRYIVSFPLEIILGKIDGERMFVFFGIQLVWIAALALSTKILWLKGLKRYAVPGQ